MMETADSKFFTAIQKSEHIINRILPKGKELALGLSHKGHHQYQLSQ